MHRTGNTYVLVLMSSLIVSTMALSSIETIRWHARDSFAESSSLGTQLAADAGLEVALARINADLNWRTNHANNVDVSPMGVNGVSVTYRLIDEDGDLTNNPDDNCDLVVTATHNGASQSIRATLTPRGEAMNCLSYGIACTKKLELKNSSVVVVDDSVASNSEVKGSGSTHLTADCFSTGNFSGNIYGSQTQLADPVAIPDVTALSYYLAQATPIDINELPTFLGVRLIRDALLSANTNTLTTDLNPNGIYHIDCEGERIDIADSRLNCTLILTDLNNQSSVSGSVYWDAPQENYPILLVDGEIDLKMNRDPLKESDVGINLNPPGTPYLGNSDSNTSTVYPSQLRGLIFASKNVDTGLFTETDVVGAIVIDDDLRTDGNLFVRYSDVFLKNPPPGFTVTLGMEIIPGTVYRTIAPY